MTDSWRKGDWMQTFTGRAFYPLDPQPADIDPEDIAHALSLQCRYGGHTGVFYSVAEHCYLMSTAVRPAHALKALLHDATEAYVIDVPRPVKRALTNYKEIEDAVWLAICKRFGIKPDMPDEVKEADNRILLTERDALMPATQYSWEQDTVYEPLKVGIRAWLPADAERFYLQRLSELL